MEPNILAKEKWPKKVQFLLGCVGFAVGFGNVWRFPYLCYKNGGGAFLIPYTICVIFGAIPMFMLEVALGQWTSQGAISCWNHFCPLLKGVGYSMVMIQYLANTYYCVIMAWAFRYLFASFTTELPWSDCSHEWNTPSCRYEVLQVSSGLNDVGVLQWKIVLCLLLSWISVYFVLFKGLKFTGKVLYVTVTAPYIFMLVLLVRGLTLPGSMSGLRYYLSPDLERLTDIQVWENAGSQVFYSYVIGVGVLTGFGSYNKFHHNFRRHCLLLVLINGFTSFLAGFVIFSALGFMSYETNTPISKVAESGPGLAFIVYPKAVSHLPVAPLWSGLFFTMLVLLGIDGLFGGIEGVVTAIIDSHPRLLRRKYGRDIILAIVLVTTALLGLSMCTNGGIYVFLLFDNYSVARTVIIVGLIQMTTISWVYGVKRFYHDVEVMLGFPVGIWIKVCWAVLAPMFSLILSVLVFLNYSEVTYNNTYKYPAWGVGLGWLMSLSSLSLIPLYMVFAVITTKGTLKQRITILLQPKPVIHEEANKDQVMDTFLETTKPVDAETNGKTAELLKS